MSIEHVTIFLYIDFLLNLSQGVCVGRRDGGVKLIYDLVYYSD